MTNLNTKKARQDLGRLISDLASDYHWASKIFLNGDSNDYESDNYYFSKLCFFSYQKTLIKLYEEYGIAYYLSEESMQDLLDDKESIFRDHDQAYEDWKKAELKSKAAA